jgi:DNA-binding response OmpR family regulator
VGGSGGAITILVVEDELRITRGFKRLLGRRGNVVAATTAREARTRLAGPGPWSGFIIDIGLPDGSGLDVLAEAHVLYPSTPALVLTGNTNASAINTAYDLHALYAVKPVDGARLERFFHLALAAASLTEVPSCVRARPVLPSSLASCIDELGRLLVRSQDAGTRYAIGALVAHLKANTELYGGGAVSAAAVSLGEDATSLYRYAAVAERWSWVEAEALLSRGLRWSHLVAVAPVESSAERARILARAINERLAAHRLDPLVRASGSKRSG